MKLFIERILQAREIIGRDLLVGLRIGLSRSLLLTGIAAITLAVLLLTQQEFQKAAKRAAAESFSSMGAVGSALAAELAAMTDEAATISGMDMDLPAALLVGVPVVKFDELSKEQRAAATFLARKYRLAPDAIAGIVSEAYRTGAELKLDPLLILAVMSIESSMNPFAESPVGAQGLMQVMTTVHAERFDEFGGPNAALNPIANIRVGAQILRELHHRFGTTERALKAYVGATDHAHDAGYGMKVLTERARLEAAVTGLPFRAPVLQQTVMADPQTLSSGTVPTLEPGATSGTLPGSGAGNALSEPRNDGSV